MKTWKLSNVGFTIALVIAFIGLLPILIYEQLKKLKRIDIFLVVAAIGFIAAVITFLTILTNWK